MEFLEAVLGTIIDAMPAGVLVADARTRRIVYHNTTARQIIGDAVNGFADAPASGRLLHADGTPIEAGDSALARALDGGVTVDNAEMRLDTADGREVFLLVSAAPIHDETGTIVAAVATFKDITEAKKAQRLAQQREAELNLLINASRLFTETIADYRGLLEIVVREIAVATGDGCTVRLVSDDGAKLEPVAAHHPDATIRIAIHELMDHTAAIADAGVWRPVVDERRLVRFAVGPDTDPPNASPIQAEFFRRHAARHFMAAPLIARGRLLGVVTLVRYRRPTSFTDADERLFRHLADRAATAIDSARLFAEVEHLLAAEREARARAEASTAATEQFLATLAHELRNPLAPISTGLQLLRRPGLGAAESERVRTMLERQTRHLVRLLDDLLDVARVKHGKIQLRRERVDLRDIAARVVESAHATAKDRPITFTAPVAAPVEGDAVRLEQIVWNLVDNALKYTAPDVPVRVAVNIDGRHAVLTVDDDGPGIPREMLPRLFELFAQGSQPLHRPRGGLGLGLALVRALVELHHGTVVVDSGPPRPGTRFTIRLPACETSPLPDAAMRAPAARRRRVLVVEDNVDARESLRLLLELDGHVVEVAADGVQAVERATCWKPDLALIDLGLPSLNGYEVAERLRAGPATRHIFLVALTGYAQPEDRARARGAGFDAHLVKPVEPDDLARVLAS